MTIEAICEAGFAPALAADHRIVISHSPDFVDSLAVPVDIIEERVIGPSLGRENIEAGIKAMAIGTAFIILFVMFYYKLVGIVTVIGLAVNMLLLVAILSILGATLTMPGIAGIVLTLGMAAVSYTHLRAHETALDLVCRPLLEKKKYRLPLTSHRINALVEEFEYAYLVRELLAHHDDVPLHSCAGARTHWT